MQLRDLFLTTSGMRQGDWVTSGKYKGIYIATISSFDSVVATYNDKHKKYVNVLTESMEKIDRIQDGNLFSYAKQHVLWRMKKIETTGTSDNKTKRKKERKSGA